VFYLIPSTATLKGSTDRGQEQGLSSRNKMTVLMTGGGNRQRSELRT
jgi:hypothetical protein